MLGSGGRIRDDACCGSERSNYYCSMLYTVINDEFAKASLVIG